MECVGWMGAILGIDYGRYELVVLYCNWMMSQLLLAPLNLFFNSSKCHKIKPIDPTHAHG